MPLSLVEAVAHAPWAGGGAFADVAAYALFYLCGYVLLADRRFRRAIERVGVLALILGLTTFTFADVVIVRGHVQPYDNSMGTLLFLPLRSIIAWFWVIGLLWLAERVFDFDGPVYRYLTPATFPIYVLHLPVLAAFASFVIRWDAALPTKYVVIALGTLTATLAIYELLIRLWPPMRLLFGLKPPLPPPGASPAPHAGADALRLPRRATPA